MSQAPKCKHGRPERGVYCKQCKLPEITISDWLEAEREINMPQVRPTGYISVPEYSQMRNISPSRARSILYELYQAGRAEREPLRIPVSGGIQYVYRLKKK